MFEKLVNMLAMPHRIVLPNSSNGRHTHFHLNSTHVPGYLRQKSRETRGSGSKQGGGGSVGTIPERLPWIYAGYRVISPAISFRMKEVPGVPVDVLY